MEEPGKLLSPLLQSGRLLDISLKTGEIFELTHPLLQPAERGKKLVVYRLGPVLTSPLLQSRGLLPSGSAEGECCVCNSQGVFGGILYKSVGCVHASLSGRRAGWLGSQDQPQAFPFATSACRRAGILFPCNIVGSLSGGFHGQDARN